MRFPKYKLAQKIFFDRITFLNSDPKQISFLELFPYYFCESSGLLLERSKITTYKLGTKYYVARNYQPTPHSD